MNDALRIATMTMHPVAAADKERQHAAKVADQFEAVFVRTMVGSLRQTASVGGEDDNMFGSGPGADTYSDWFDQNLAEQIGKSGRIGIAKQIMKDFEHDGALQKGAVDQADKKMRATNAANNHNAFNAVKAAKAGFDVVL